MAYWVSEIMAAILHNDFIMIPFSIFRLFTVISLTLMLFFFFRLPGYVWPRYAQKGDGLICPRHFLPKYFSLSSCTAFLHHRSLINTEKHRKPSLQHEGFRHSLFSVPGRIRTAGLPLRRRTLYPAELQKHSDIFINN